MKKLLSIILTVALIICAVPFGAFTLTASAATSGTTGDCTWTLDGTTLTISGNGKMGNYSYDSKLPWGKSITEVIINSGVTSIGWMAFSGCSSLTSVNIPDSVTSIGNGAFSGCSNLTSVTIGNSVTSIGYHAFYGCSSLTSVNIPDSVTSIGGSAFYKCSSLEKVNITDIAKWCDIKFNSDYFSDYYSNPLTYAHNLYLNGTKITNLVIPDSLTSIGDYVFNGCSSLKSVIIPDSLTSIGERAFYGCSILTDVYYTGSKTEADNIDIGLYNDEFKNATWHYNTCNSDEHVYDNDCDTTCNACDWVRTITHSYKTVWLSNATEHWHECSVCGDKTDVTTHSYDNACDTTCNVCGATRTIAHTYDNACDTTCNICGYVRSVGDHVYDNSCDATCNICGATRTVHKYNDCFIGYNEELCGSWQISVNNSGVYRLSPTPSSNYTGNFSNHYIAVFDSNDNAIKYNEAKQGWPLVKDQQYTVKFRYNCSDEIVGSINWSKTKISGTIFPDTNSGAWYNDAVTYAVGKGIMSGYGNGNFGPADSIQRQDFLVMLARYDGVDLSQYTGRSRFADVQTGSYYAAAVNWGAEKGIVSGYQGGTVFGVGDVITREQLVTFLYRYANYKGIDVSYSNSIRVEAQRKYKDYSQVSDWSLDCVMWALENNVINGKNANTSSPTIAPQGNAQRCEVAQIMYNIFKNDVF